MGLAVFVCMFGASSIIAIVTWWRQPQLWWACLGILASATVVVLYLPVRVVFYSPSSECADDLFGRLGILVEYVAFCGFAVVVNLGSLVAISLLTVDKVIERKKAAGKTESE